MLSRLIAFCLCIAASGCLRESVERTDAPVRGARTVWHASVDNGDKPGNGIRLVDEAGQISATFFLLDPNKPHDFKAGRALPTDVVQSNETEVRLVVRLDNGRKDEFAIVLHGRLKGNRVNATLHDVRGESTPTTLTFVRQR
jgi:hypothetical protein